MRTDRKVWSYTSTHPYVIWAWKLIKNKKNITSPSTVFCEPVWIQIGYGIFIRETARPQPKLCFRQLVQSSVFVILLNQYNSTAEVSKNVKHLASCKSGGLGGILPFLSRLSKRIHFFFIPLLTWIIIPLALQAKSGGGRSLLRFIYHTQAHTPGRTPLNEWSAYRRGCYLHDIQMTQDTNVCAFSGFRTSDPNNQASPRPPGTALTCTTCTFNLSVASVWEQTVGFLIRELQICVIF
jgi:hypothetical protein